MHLSIHRSKLFGKYVNNVERNPHTLPNLVYTLREVEIVAVYGTKKKSKL